MSIACGTNKNYIHSWGHTHSDKLSIELQVDGVDILLDPGTYIYTPLPNARNAFRAVANHNTLVVNNEEQNWWYDGKKGLFKMMKQTNCEILNISPHEIKIALQYRQNIQIRQLLIWVLSW
ncbi:MAG: heparinase II/III family protein [Bacteroidetes bacterium]|nr:heparinase II/III family protein [Bacteroidota bacterium]